MRKVLSLPQLIFYGVGMIVGSGIYSVIGKAAGVAGETVWLSLLIGGITAALTALSYAELSSMFPQAGAEYIYLKNIFPTLPRLSFLCGSLMVFSGAATAATVAVAFSGYMLQFFAVPVLLTACVVLILFTALNIWGLKESSWANVVFTLVELAGLVLFVAVAWRSEDFGKSLQHVEISSQTISGAALVIFAYFGFETIVNFTEETENAEKRVPRAVLISLVTAAGLYFLVGLAALALLSPQELFQSQAPLSDALRERSEGMAKVLGGIAMFSTANTVLISMLSTSRIVYSMAREEDLPPLLSRLRKKRQTPWTAALFVLVFALILLPAGGVEVLASVSSLATMIAFTLINLSVIHLRYVEPHMPRPFRIPGHIGRFPILPALAVLTNVALLFYFEMKVYLLALGFAVIAVLYYVLRKRRR